MLSFQQVLIFFKDLMWLLRHTENIYLFYRWDLLLLVSFLSNQRIYVWFTMTQIYLTTFIIELMNISKGKFSIFHHRLRIILIIIFTWIKKLFYNIIWFIINHDFYVITFWIHYMLFIIICGKNKVNYYC